MKGLIFREFFIARTKIIYGSLTVLISSAVMLLILLSFRHGNLALLPDNIRDGVFEGLSAIMEMFLPFFVGTVMLGVAGSGERDELPAWQRFRRSTPVPPLKFAIAKYAIFAAIGIIGFGVSMLYYLAAGAVSESSFKADSAALAAMVLLFSTALNIFFSVMLMLLHTADKAWISMLAVVMIVMIPLITSDKLSDMEITEVVGKLKDFCTDIFPFTPLIFAGLLAAGRTVTTAILNRREKQ